MIYGDIRGRLRVSGVLQTLSPWRCSIRCLAVVPKVEFNDASSLCVYLKERESGSAPIGMLPFQPLIADGFHFSN